MDKIKKINNTKLNPASITVFYILDKVIVALGAVFIIRILQPSAFGIAGLAQMFMSIITIGKFCIFHSALIYEKDDKDSVYNVGFTSDLALSTLLYLVLFVLAPLWAIFYKTEVLTSLIRVGGLAIIIDSFGLVPMAKLEKKLKFNILFKLTLFISSFRIVFTIILASMGFSFWSIIWAHIASGLFSVLLFNLVEFTPIKFDMNIIILKKLLSYGKYVFIIQIMAFILSNIAGLFIGRIIGVMALGYFLVAYKWGFWIMNNIFAPIDRILFPTYAKFRQNSKVLKELFLKTLRYSSIIVFFISVSLFLVAKEFVDIVLGQKWSSVVMPLKILCFAGLVEFIGLLSYTYLKGTGYIKVESMRGIIYSAILIFILYPFIHAYGITGASVAVLLATTVTQSIYIVYSAKRININFLDIFKNIAIPMISAFFMTGAIFIARPLISNAGIEGIRHFIFLILIELCIYSMSILLFMGKEIFAALRNIKRVSFDIKGISATPISQG